MGSQPPGLWMPDQVRNDDMATASRETLWLAALGQLEDTFGDDVAQDFGGAALNGIGPSAEKTVLPIMFRFGFIVKLAGCPLHLDSEVLHALVGFSPMQLGN